MQQRNAISFFKQKGQEVKRNAGKSKLHSLFFSLFLFYLLPCNKNPQRKSVGDVACIFLLDKG